MSTSPRSRSALLATLALLYTAQGLPLGVASEYLPVVLREAGFSRTAIASTFWLQFPWWLKIFWARAGDLPSVRPYARHALLGVQLVLAASVVSYALFDVHHAARAWFAITVFAAFAAATQDVFVDALAVRSLAPADRGYGNIAQVAGYRLGMLAGGAGLLLIASEKGTKLPLAVASIAIALVGFAAFVLRSRSDDAIPERRPLDLPAMLRHVFARDTWPVLAMVLLYKFGTHMASAILKPMVVDAHWTEREIGMAVVTIGIAAALAGASFGGFVYRALGERRALAAGALLHASTAVPLTLAATFGVPHAFTTFAIAVEHFASGLGTTILFASLMSAARPSSAALHYTVLTSANALVIGVGGMAGGWLADRIHEAPTFVIAGVVSLLPLVLLPRWDAAVRASAAEA